MPIYTKTGDRGETGLLGGKRVPKSHPQIMALGSLDELNAFIGLVKTKIKNNDDKEFLALIQHDLYLIMSFLSDSPISLTPLTKKVKEFEQKIDFIEKKLPKLKGFIVPGGNEISAWFHVLRVICRKAEREVVKNVASSKLSKIIQYLNRLSDLFFVLARKYHV